MEQGKEPSQRSFELTAHERVRQESIAHSRPSAGDFVWHLCETLDDGREQTDTGHCSIATDRRSATHKRQSLR
jgi:hypothetical protein